MVRRLIVSNAIREWFEIIVSTVAFLAISSALADDNSYWSRGFPGETDEMKMLIAGSAEPRWVTTKTDSNVELLITQECGSMSDELSMFLTEKALMLNGLTSPTSKITAGSTAAIPFCHKLERNVDVVVRKGDVPETLLKEYAGVYGPRTVAEFVALSADGGALSSNITDEEIDKFSRSLVPGSTVTLPYASEPRLLTVSGNSTHPQYILMENPPQEFDLNAALGTIEAIFPQVVPPETTQFILDELVTLAAVRNDSSCPEVAVDTDGLVIAEDIKKRYMAEKAVLETAGLFVEHAVIATVDSGLESVGQGLFLESLFEQNKNEVALARDGVDDDGNGFVDDVWGINFSTKNGDIDHFYRPGSAVTPVKMQHGTNIAAVALGGPDWLSLNTARDFIASRLIVINFGSPGGNGTQPPYKIRNAVEYARDRDAKIINLSLSTEAKLVPLETAIQQSERQALFVVAAGNNSAGGKNLDLIKAFPAKFGGKNAQHKNVLTVGAHQPDGKRAAFSNYGDRVDLMAPGCGVETVGANGELLFVDGTSIAAAAVTFASSLVKSLGGDRMKPERIKERLIISGDFLEESPSPSWTNTRLNVLKSISLTHDVLEVTKEDTISETLFVNLSDREMLRAYCKNADLRLSLDGIRRVRPNIRAGDGGRYVEYWIKPADTLVVLKCEQHNANIPVGYLTEAGEPGEPLMITEIRDIVLSEFVGTSGGNE